MLKKIAGEEEEGKKKISLLAQNSSVLAQNTTANAEISAPHNKRNELMCTHGGM